MRWKLNRRGSLWPTAHCAGGGPCRLRGRAGLLPAVPGILPGTSGVAVRPRRGALTAPSGSGRSAPLPALGVATQMEARSFLKSILGLRTLCAMATALARCGAERPHQEGAPQSAPPWAHHRARLAQQRARHSRSTLPLRAASAVPTPRQSTPTATVAGAGPDAMIKMKTLLALR